MYEEGLSAEGIKQLFEKIIIFEQGEIGEEIKNQYNVDDEQFKELIKYRNHLEQSYKIKANQVLRKEFN